MWRCRLTELNWVRTRIWFSPEWRQLAMGMSIRRYFPAIGTAGLLRDLVSGYSRVPRPPPRIRQITLTMVAPRSDGNASRASWGAGSVFILRDAKMLCYASVDGTR